MKCRNSAGLSIQYQLLTYLTVGCLLLGCIATPWLDYSENKEKKLLGQVLPITAKTTIGKQTIWLEVAKTKQEQVLGLMYRTLLPHDRGMLFVLNTPKKVAFWMKNCKIPLDIIFLREGVVRYILVNAPPCESGFCPIYKPDIFVDQVIELRGGQALEFALEVGIHLSIEPI